MAKTKKIISHLSCGECSSKNYTHVVGKSRKLGSLSLKKFCFYPKCRRHTMHKEVK